ncbi:40-residue YVTN family beta-propeller repeat protein [Granulicella tundricola MP5ACTX9]|uniref:40-residue YVTN family beta-propeller repeat protein n=1 Tax=Granulicella tundricola (strain ATCC BAA-1859 / DSM 23138 / MP5ACTX9) TaxID=1198114 RepID=E8X542_GRATM|nr:40-residue YVTN family beta-propeller repeat protein [Granulicella tundricola MP5ACTX9]
MPGSTPRYNPVSYRDHSQNNPQPYTSPSHPPHPSTKLTKVFSSPQSLRGILLAAALLPLAACKHYNMPDYPAGYREFAYVANSTGNTVTVLDLVYLRPDRTLKVGADPTAIAVNPKLDEAYALNTQPSDSTGSVSVIDTDKNEVVATIPVHRTPSALAISPDGLRAYVTNQGSNTVSVLDLKTRRAIASAPTGDQPAGIAIAPDNRSVVVTNQASGSVSIYAIGIQKASPLTLRATFPGCPGATSPVIMPDSAKTFVACSTGHQIMAIGLSMAPDSWALKQDASLNTDRLLALLVVGQHPTHITMKPDGGEVFVSNQASDSISEVSTQTNDVGSTYAIGDRPTHGVVSADNSALWVAASGNDSVSLYSIDDGKFLSSLRTGSTPDALAFSADQHLILAADSHSGDVAVIRTATKLGPALLTILPAGGTPVALAVKATQTKP